MYMWKCELRKTRFALTLLGYTGRERYKKRLAENRHRPRPPSHAVMNDFPPVRVVGFSLSLLLVPFS